MSEERQTYNPQDNLEYNDGLGDLLREKDKMKFSWVKTVLVLITLIFIIFIVLTLGFNIIKSFFTVEDTSARNEVIEAVPYVEEQEFQEKLNDIIAEEEKLLKEVPTTVVPAPSPAQANSGSTASKPTPQPASETAAKPVNASPAPEKKQVLYKVIAGTFSEKKNAERQVAKLKSQKIDSFVRQTTSKGKTVYEVQAGAYHHFADAKTQAERIEKKGVSTYVVKE